jgi:tripartite-type tricarboxylate transporter receptor subunit TctC
MGKDAMTLPRRQFLLLAASTAAFSATSHIAIAQTYPSRPVRMLVGYPPGGGADIVARLICQWLAEKLGRPFVVENRPGAATNLAAETAVRAPGDGHTLMLITAANTINATLYDKPTFDFLRDITPVASISRGPLFMVVNPSFPAKNVPEFIAYAKANQGKINMASPGSGSPNHVAGEMFKMMAESTMTHVPYRGESLAMTDLLGGQVHVLFPGGAAIEYIKAGKLRALAVTTGRRSQALPEIPAMAEFVPGYEANVWFGIGAPKSTPVEIIDRLNIEINACVADPRVKARLADLGHEAMPMTPPEFNKFVAAETEKWAKVVRFAGIKAE